MFTLQSIVSALIIAILADWTNQTQGNGFSYLNIISAGDIMRMCFVPAGIGLATGLLSGMLSRLIRQDHLWISLSDGEFWLKNDCLNSHRQPGQKQSNGQFAPGIADGL